MWKEAAVAVAEVGHDAQPVETPSTPRRSWCPRHAPRSAGYHAAKVVIADGADEARRASRAHWSVVAGAGRSSGVGHIERLVHARDVNDQFAHRDDPASQILPQGVFGHRLKFLRRRRRDPLCRLEGRTYASARSLPFVVAVRADGERQTTAGVAPLANDASGRSRPPDGKRRPTVRHTLTRQSSPPLFSGVPGARCCPRAARTSLHPRLQDPPRLPHLRGRSGRRLQRPPLMRTSAQAPQPA